jgi:hypothetical protein
VDAGGKAVAEHHHLGELLFALPDRAVVPRLGHTPHEVPQCQQYQEDEELAELERQLHRAYSSTTAVP